VKTLFKLLTLFLILPLLYGCPSATLGTAKKEVRDSIVMEIKDEIEKLGEVPISKNEARFKGILNKDKYIVALRKQLEEIKQKIEDEKAKAVADKEAEKAKAEADKKAEEEKKKAEEKKKKKEQDRAKVIQQIKKEIIFLGETPILEFEVDSEDKYLTALKKQFEEIKALKKKEEKEINQAIPEWYQNMPKGSETVFYSRGTDISSDLQKSEDYATENALFAVAKKLENRIGYKLDRIIREAGIDKDNVLKEEIKTIAKLVYKDIKVYGYRVVKTKMLSLNTGKFRTYVLIEYPLTPAYKNLFEQIDSNNKIKANLAKIKNTEAYKQLEKDVKEFSGS
jgi:hypothetical protein|tara:strand:+ start:206 stop:1219 length:1014 start_codon:yes stop_codon:yes gene_type:complete